MTRTLVLLTLSVLASPVVAHEDRVLPIREDGTLDGLPARYGTVKVEIVRTEKSQDSIEKVVISSPRFRTTLNQCVLRKLKNVAHVDASGSWYHANSDLPPYVTLTFYSNLGNAMGNNSEYYAVTYSLLDGKILSGMRSKVTIFGQWGGRYIYPADSCSHWRWAGMWPNNSFKPNPLGGSA